ncbi:MAG: dihydroorotate dehydrogenase, partial [Actinomycetota bacterium]
MRLPFVRPRPSAPTSAPTSTGSPTVNAAAVDLRVRIGSVELPSPVLLASGTAGYGDELAPYLDLAELGAVDTKSLASFEWAGNPPPRLSPAGIGMVNAVGLQGPGVEH